MWDLEKMDAGHRYQSALIYLTNKGYTNLLSHIRKVHPEELTGTTTGPLDQFVDKKASSIYGTTFSL